MLGDYMCSEEMTLWSRFGEKGVDWIDPEPGDVSAYASAGFPPFIKSLTTWGIAQNKWWAQVGPNIMGYKLIGQVTPNPYDVQNAIGPNILPQIQHANRTPIVGLNYLEQELEVMRDFHQTILTYVQESYARFVTGDLSIDRDWDRYVNEFSRMSLNEVIRVTQSCWDRMNK